MRSSASRRRALAACACLVALAGGVPSARQHASASSSAAPRAGILVIELPSGRAVSTVRADLVNARIAPGSILKIATLIAALESGVVSPSTKFTCRRRVQAGGRELVCVHPDLGRPLTPAEALAYSCDDFFVTVAERLPRGALDAAITAMGLPAASADAPLPLAAVGLAGIEATPEQLLRAFVRVVQPDGMRMRADTRRVVLDGLRGAAQYGTAQAFRSNALDALAKTGTAPMPAGGYHGLVVAVVPSDHPTRGIVVLVPGGSGADAAQVAADALAGRQPAATGRPPTAAPTGEAPQATIPQTVRVGHAVRAGYDVTEMPIEEYVARVVGGEAGPGTPPSALEALAIAARTFAVANMGRHRANGFDLCDLTHCQVAGQASAASRSATAATSGRILLYQGKPAAVFYSASCGGSSELPADVWPRAQNPPFLVHRDEPQCAAESRWTSEIFAGELLRAFVAAGLRGDEVRDLRVVARSSSGRASTLAVDGLVPSQITGDEMRLAVGRTLGWQRLKSTLFDIERTSGGYRFTGTGSGHGVGMCLAGARRMAAAGKTADDILAAYYPGTTISTHSLRPNPETAPAHAEARPAAAHADSGADVRTPETLRLELVLPLGDERSRDTIDHLMRSGLQDMAQRIHVALPSHVRMVFHPTVESYCRQTKQPWWTAASTSGDRVDLLPVPVLVERRILEPTIRHELAHLLTAPALSHRAEWVKEGAAIYLSGEHIESPGSIAHAGKLRCPTDEDLRNSQSGAALQDAYARATACYQAQIAAGRKWDEVK